MRILNIMLSRDLGGIQQSFLSYSDALKLEGFDVINFTSFFAKINKFVSNKWQLLNLGPWDILSSFYLKCIIILLKPDIIIAHGNRAIKFTNGIHVPVIGVAHNYNFKYLKKCSYVIALTEHMHKYLIQNNFLATRIFVIPNMINVDQDLILKEYRHPIIIGSVARLVSKKGIDILLHALVKLKRQRYKFELIVGGEGEDKNNLLSLTKSLGLENEVRFIGWIENKRQFFTDIDIFILPSLHEPFGITILEAMAHSIPIIATKTEGPIEIIRDPQDGLLCDVNSSDDLAKKLSYLIDNPALAKRYIKSSYSRVMENYDTRIVAKILAFHLKSVINQ